MYHYLFSLVILTIFLLSCESQSTTIPARDISLIRLDTTDLSGRLVSVLLDEYEGQLYAYAAGEQQTLQVYEVSASDHLSLIQEIKHTDRRGGARALTSVSADDSEYIIMGNKANDAIEVYRQQANGTLLLINSTYDTDSSYIGEVVTIDHLTIDGHSYIYAGGLDRGMSVYELLPKGKLQHVQSIAHDSLHYVHGMIGMTTLERSGRLYAFTGSFFDGGVTSYRVAQDGRLEYISHISDDDELYLNGTFSLTATTIDSSSYLIVGHRHNVHYGTDGAEKDYHGDGINVFKIHSDGRINPHSTVTDDEQLRFKGITRIELLSLSDTEQYVFIATRDDQGIQICRLDPAGILRPISSIDLGYAVYNGMTIKKHKNRYYLLVGAYDQKRLEIYEISIAG